MRDWLAIATAAFLVAGCGAEGPGDADGGAGDGSMDGAGDGAPPYHPLGYIASSAHGMETKLQKQDCRVCHGADLNGGAGPSCDDCHTPADPPSWRTNCTFCHGGIENQTGAPPRNLDGTSDLTLAKFPPHGKHVGTQLTSTIDCTQCHVKATDVLSPDHVFDFTPGVAETDFGAGRSKQAVWTSATGTCTNLYCHGNGRGDNGTMKITDDPRDCGSCHASLADPAGWSAMSGPHATHLSNTAMGAITCSDCHATVVDAAATALTDPNLHINGVRDVAIPSGDGVTYDPTTATCAGTCHGYSHGTGVIWIGGAVGDRYHPAGWVAAKGQSQPHGVGLELSRQDCRSCHGGGALDGLTGSQAQTCDQCHSANGDAAWRTTCTFCHGSAGKGAPPRDLASLPGSVSSSFRAHGTHLTQILSKASDCSECHVDPSGTADPVQAPNHLFDTVFGSSAGTAEVTFAGSALASATSFTHATVTCATNYCHGNGRGNNGSYQDGGATPTCAGCHPGQSSNATAWRTMSGHHYGSHLEKGATCADCHLTTTTTNTTVAAPLQHLDGQRQVAFKLAGITWSAAARTCTGSCHLGGGTKNHNGSAW